MLQQAFCVTMWLETQHTMSMINIMLSVCSELTRSTVVDATASVLCYDVVRNAAHQVHDKYNVICLFRTYLKHCCRCYSKRSVLRWG